MSEPSVSTADNARLVVEALRRAELFAQVRQITLAITSQRERSQLLPLIVEHAVALLRAKSGGLYEYHPEQGVLELVADYERPRSLVGHTLRAGEGMAGRLICDEAPFLCTDDYDTCPYRAPSYTLPRIFGAVLEVPLIWQGQRIGVLYVDDLRGRPFSELDIEALQLLADHAAIALVNANLVARERAHQGRLEELSNQAHAQTDYLNRLVASLPNGVIAIDNNGRVTMFNQQAAQMLHYGDAEVLGQAVDPLFSDALEPRRIGRRLHESSDGRLDGYETTIRSKSGDRIPIRLAATWLYDAQGRRSGSVGYFEDLRASNETQRRLDLLLQACTIVAQAEQFEVGLTKLAEMLVRLYECSFCRVFLLDEGKQHLITAAAYPVDGDHRRLEWSPGLASRARLADWPQLDAILEQGRPRVLRLRTPRYRAALEQWSRRLQLHYDIQSLLVIPLRAHDRIVGLIDLGEIRPWQLAPFSFEKLAFASAIGEQTALLIDRMRMYAQADRQRLQFAALDAAARQLRAEKDPVRLNQTIVNLAIGLAEGSAGGLFLNHSHIEEVELVAAAGFPPVNIGRRQHTSEGLIGHVARAGGPEIAYNYTTYWQNQDPLLQPYRFQSLIAVPLRHAGEVEAVLFVAHTGDAYHFTSTTIEILERFAEHGGVVLRTARLLSREQRAFSHLAILHQMSDYIQSARNLDQLLQLALTAITAGYGLGFNRAAIFLLDDRGTQLIGQMGIGHIYPSEAEHAWVEHARSGLEDYRRYRDQLEQQRIPLTPVGERVSRMRLQLGPTAADAFAQVLEFRTWRIIHPEAHDTLPAGFKGALLPTTTLVAVPLIARDTVIGVLVADNKFTREPITHELIDSLLAFANPTAIAIDRHRLLHAAHEAHQTLQSFYEASNAIEWAQSPHSVLCEIAERARQAASARGVSLVLFDAREQITDVITAGADQRIDLASIIRPNGISIQVLRTGEPMVIEDANTQRAIVNPSMFDREVAAGLCLPVALAGRRLGVMWVHYEAPRSFAAAEIAAIQLYVNQAAIAYDNANQINALRKARDTARIVAQLTMLGQLQPTLESIVEGSRNVLGCDAVSLYQYQIERNLLIQPPITIGLRYPNRASRTDAQALAAAAFVFDMLTLERMELIEDTSRDPRFANRRFTREEGVCSCAVMPLRVGAKRVGVMFVNYRQPHQFLPDETTNLEIFAYQAAVAIYNAQLFDQVQRRATTLQALYEAGSAIAGKLDQQQILTLVAEQACALMHSYGRPSTFSLIGLVHDEQVVFAAAHPPNTLPALRKRIGLAIDLRPGMAGKIGIIGRAVLLGASQRIGDVRPDPHYIEYMPGTRSELAVPIRIRERVVGVINLEHAERDVFDTEHQQALELLAAQAAIAIENAQLFKDTRSLYNVIVAASSALHIDTVLRATTASIAREFSYESVGIHLLDEVTGTLTGPTYYAGTWQRTPNLSPDQGITRRVARSGQPALVPDVSNDPDYVVGAARTRSELCVPLLLNEKVIGVINVESSNLHAFNTHDLHQLETIARQLANRIENARLYTELDHAKITLAARTAVAWMGMVSATWRHKIEGHAATISTEVNIIRAELARAGQAGEELTARLGERIAKIARMAQQIIQHKIPQAPASADEAVSVQVADLLRERLRQLQEHEAYQAIEFCFAPPEGEPITVRISHAWLRELCDILINNAIAAVQRTRDRRITIGLARLDGQVQITVCDTGRGIPKKIQRLLFKRQIDKAQGERGMGIGLLLAQTIAQMYGGNIVLEHTSPHGTTMAVVLPIEHARRDGAHD